MERGGLGGWVNNLKCNFVLSMQSCIHCSCNLSWPLTGGHTAAGKSCQAFQISAANLGSGALVFTPMNSPIESPAPNPNPLNMGEKKTRIVSVPDKPLDQAATYHRLVWALSASRTEPRKETANNSLKGASFTLGIPDLLFAVCSIKENLEKQLHTATYELGLLEWSQYERMPKFKL